MSENKELALEMVKLFESHPWKQLEKGSKKKAAQFKRQLLKAIGLVPEHPQTIIDNESILDTMIHELSFDGEEFEEATAKLREGLGMLQTAIRRKWPFEYWPNFEIDNIEEIYE